MLLQDVKDIKKGRIISGQRELTLDSKTKDDREPDQSDIEAAQRGNNMVGMSVADLNDLVRLMEGKPTFAAKVTVIAAKQMIAAKKRMGAGDFKSTKDQIAELESQKEEAKKMGYGTDAYDAAIKELQKDAGISREKYNQMKRDAENDLVEATRKNDVAGIKEAKDLLSDIEKDWEESVAANRDSADIFTQDPLTEKGKEILAAMKKQYGEEKGEQVFYASKNAGKITGVDSVKDAEIEIRQGLEYTFEERDKILKKFGNKIHFISSGNGYFRIDKIDKEDSDAQGKAATGDAPAPKEFDYLKDWQNAAMERGYRLQNSLQRGMWIAYQGNREMGTFVRTRGGKLYLDSKTKDANDIWAVVFENTVMATYPTESQARNFINRLHGTREDKQGYYVKQVDPKIKQGDRVRDSKTKDYKPTINFIGGKYKVKNEEGDYVGAYTKESDAKRHLDVLIARWEKQGKTKDDSRSEQAYDEGYEMALMGKSITANPYKDVSRSGYADLKESWEDGYRDGRSSKSSKDSKTKDDSRSEQAYDEGYEAALQGKPFTANPYKDVSRSGYADLRESWDDGHRNGQKEVARRVFKKDSKTKDAEWKVKIKGSNYAGKVFGEISKTVTLPGGEGYRNRDIVANQLRDELLRKYPLTQVVDFEVISVNGRQWNPGGSSLARDSKTKDFKAKSPGWYVVNNNDEPIEGPFNEIKCKQRAKELGMDYVYITDYDLHRSNDSDIIINVVETPKEEVESEEEAFDLVHYNGYNIKLVKETGEYDIYDVGGAMIGHTATLELAKLFVDNKGNATIVYE